jgi:PPOX class probable FMN-dependent enzyme
VGTASPDGRCDVSPKGDPPGFVKVLDEWTLAIPERAGNRRMDGHHNLLENPHVGLLLVIPGRADTLRINGSARLVTDGPFFRDMVVRGHRPSLALVVDVEEVFFHCPKAFVRAHAWQPDRWHPEAARSYGHIAKALWRRGEDLEQIEARLTPEAIEAQLYPAPSRGVVD